MCWNEKLYAICEGAGVDAVCVCVCVSLRVCVGKKNVISFGRSRSQPGAKLPYTYTYLSLGKAYTESERIFLGKSCYLARFFSSFPACN